MARRPSYSFLQIGLHWLIALLILTAWVTGDGMGRALRQRMESGATGIEGNTLHVWLGGAVFLLVLIRLAVRLFAGAPAPVQGAHRLAETAAVWGHRLLYVLMIGVPALGILTWYLRVPEAGDVHAVIANGLMLVALGHALIAIAHHLVLKDATLSRMVPGLPAPRR